MSKAHHQIGPPSRHPDQVGQLRSQTRHLDRLIDESVPEPERSGLKGKALAGPPHADPMVGVFALGHENREASR